jgi:hypothetical protein
MSSLQHKLIYTAISKPAICLEHRRLHELIVNMPQLEVEQSCYRQL